MRVSKEQVNRIRDLAIRNFIEQPMDLSWDRQRTEIDESERRVIAYMEAMVSILELDIDVDYYKRIDVGVYEKNGRKK